MPNSSRRIQSLILYLRMSECNFEVRQTVQFDVLSCDFLSVEHRRRMSVMCCDWLVNLDINVPLDPIGASPWRHSSLYLNNSFLLKIVEIEHLNVPY